MHIIDNLYTNINLNVQCINYYLVVLTKLDVA